MYMATLTVCCVMTKSFYCFLLFKLLEKEMAAHSSILAWRIPWTEELGGLQSTGCKESDTTERLHFLFRLLGNIRLSLSTKIKLIHEIKYRYILTCHKFR